ncbi:conjugal transfer protein TrbF [Asticcacaulis sp. SL142]|uniref:conjugal transfer protein TrbF n=1 Tax=Asticcacaulis sp. SL142 TaxID=2995155 RepID=UPI00226CC2FE|nr:conjugal transfer protein TrbF [Asticcacaulis sp. SL142]WAC49736.1 conjugal transfer protein TrbF [Asticcacaulis sp. SL142]
MSFKRSLQRYGQTPEPITPYQKAAQVWDERIGSSAAQARNWRLLAYGALSVSLVLAGGMVWLASQSRVTPYVVEVDSRSGSIKALGPATEAYKPSDAQISWYMARFITNLRSLSIDPVLVRENWLEAYDFTTQGAAQYLNDQARQRDPFAGVGERSVTVSITSVVRASKTSFQVKWNELTYIHGVLTRTERWTAILGVVQKPPTREETLRKNPLGLYVNQMAWSQDYAPDAERIAAESTDASAKTSLRPVADDAALSANPQSQPLQ